MDKIKLITKPGKSEATFFAAFSENADLGELSSKETWGKLGGGDLMELSDCHPPFPIPVGASGEGQGFAARFMLSRIKYVEGREALKTAAAEAWKLARKLKVERVVLLLDGEQGKDWVKAAAEGVALAAYDYTAGKGAGRKVPKQHLKAEILLAGTASKSVQSDVDQALSVAKWTNLARDLVNTPPSEMNPTALADQAKKVAAAHGSLTCRIMNDAALRKAGYNGVAMVGQGSVTPPCMIVLHYKPTKTVKGVHLALVGKGVTFDTGGYCIKPARDMWKMKGDMAGGAAVVAAMGAIAEMNLPVEVTGIVPAACNAVDAKAMLPGDIIRTANGKTVQIDNTDAEGRLLLMDALQEAARLKATHAVDIATLTGSAANALGPAMAALFTDEDDWAARIDASGIAAGEMFWRLPLHAEYVEMLKCEAADLNNTGNSPRAGAITAALFLKEFVDPKMTWAHLDIAGTFMLDKPWRYLGAGGTGFGVRTFVELVRSFAPTKKA